MCLHMGVVGPHKPPHALGDPTAPTPGDGRCTPASPPQSQARIFRLFSRLRRRARSRSIPDWRAPRANERRVSVRQSPGCIWLCPAPCPRAVLHRRTRGTDAHEVLGGIGSPIVRLGGPTTWCSRRARRSHWPCCTSRTTWPSCVRTCSSAPRCPSPTKTVGSRSRPKTAEPAAPPKESRSSSFAAKRIAGLGASRQTDQRGLRPAKRPSRSSAECGSWGGWDAFFLTLWPPQTPRPASEASSPSLEKVVFSFAPDSLMTAHLPSSAAPSRRKLAKDILNLPNLLTMGRVAVIPFLSGWSTRQPPSAASGRACCSRPPP